MRRLRLGIEFALLFFGIPWAYRAGWVGLQINGQWEPLHVFALLWLMTIGSVAWLLLSRRFDRRNLWRASALPQHLPRILALFLPGAVLILLGVVMLNPTWLFGFVENEPAVWAVIMFAYPVFSVYPQSLIYRAFLFERYAELLTTPRARIVGSAVAFGYMHIIFNNAIAPTMTLLGGLLFAYTYERSRSLLTSAVEHALYGCWIFTTGWGLHFLHRVPEPWRETAGL